jgi:hypothetical protein
MLSVLRSSSFPHTCATLHGNLFDPGCLGQSAGRSESKDKISAARCLPINPPLFGAIVQHRGGNSSFFKGDVANSPHQTPIKWDAYWPAVPRVAPDATFSGRMRTAPIWTELLRSINKRLAAMYSEHLLESALRYTRRPHSVAHRFMGHRQYTDAR